jgi:uncharacterized membrane protein
MMETQFRISPDIPVALAILVVLVIVALAGQFCLATYRRSVPKFVLLLGVSAHFALVIALLRPTILQRKSHEVGPRVAILVDASRRLRLASHGRSRAKSAEKAVADLLRKFSSARTDLMVFGDDGPVLLSSVAQLPNAMNSSEGSDLTRALNALTETVSEPPASVVLVTDGRLTRPESVVAASREFAQSLKGIPIYGVDVGGAAIPDASIRSVSGLGHAVAHQSFSLRVEVSCGGGLTCQQVPVYVREFERGRKSRDLAQSNAELTGREATVLDISVVFERAGTHILKLSLAPQMGDQVPANDSRYLLFNVARERVRLLHIAGSPSYDVRELRRWLKGNASVDLVSFFILRTDDDDTNTAENSGELALIPFPVDELFDRHLSSFDGVILQDIDAARYHLDVHLDQLARYVEEGGGLVLAGGPAAFSGGAYAHSALERVLPTSMVVTRTPFDSVDFVPTTTPVGLEAPILAAVRRLLGERLPTFPGANTLGPPKPDARVLWVHPTRTFLPVRGQSVAGGPMPVLAIRDVNEGRTVALGLDATYRFAWGALAAESSGRAYGAFWEAIIGWVMHEARFEPFRGGLKSPCVVGVPTTLKWTVPLGTKGEMSVDVQRLDSEGLEMHKVALVGNGDVEVKLGDLVAGAYTSNARINGGLAARLDFFCEEGGAALADSRPDPERLRQLTSMMGGRTVGSDNINALPVPPSLFVDESRTSRAVGPAWLWSLMAAALLGATWLSARRYGMR